MQWLPILVLVIAEGSVSLIIYLFIYFLWYSDSGEMCAMKEVTLFSDDAKSKESAKQLMQVRRFFIGLNSCFYSKC